MKTNKLFLFIIIYGILLPSINAQVDTLAIHNLGHASLMFEFKDLIIHVDPRSQEANYTDLPDADLIFVTHGHSDHYDISALNEIKKESTILVTTQTVKDLGTYSDSIYIIANGDTAECMGLNVIAVPAYNHTATQHPKGIGNGYVITFGQTKVYIAGDTEDIEEMKTIDADIVFIPMNQPYTMTPEQAVNAALMISPDILYIYHFGSSDTAKLRTLLKEYDSIEVRIGESLYYEPKRVISEEPEEPESNRSDQQKEVFVYPNPFNETIQLENLEGNTRIVIYRIDGKVMKQTETSLSSLTIELKDLPAGLYFLSSEAKVGTHDWKIVKY